VERIAVGGGLRGSRVGELVIGQASVRLKGAGRRLDVQPIHSDPDEAGLIGAVHLAPDWVLGGHDGILAVDIGGSNVRAGVVGLAPRRNGRPPKGAVRDLELWRHADEDVQPSRDETIERIVAMLARLAGSAAEHDLELAPFIGVACPGVIAADGRIERGGQNLPGDWESGDFNLPARLRQLGPRIAEREPLVVLHNDAVVQGLSELPFIEDVRRWGVLTIGTGLGNAAFTNRAQVGAAPISGP
jgi:predicted NBD/HSP70 family sugar kinase